MIQITMAKEDALKITWRFLANNNEKIEKLCRVWNSPPTSLLEWVLKEGLEQLECHTGMLMLHQEVSS